MVYHERALHNYLIPCHKKIHAVANTVNAKYVQRINDGKVGCNTVEYTMDFLQSDWLCFLWHGISKYITSFT